MTGLKRIVPALAAFWLASAGGASALDYALMEAELPNCRGACPKVVVATGTIQQNEHLRFLSFLERSVEESKVSQVMVIDSPGGFTLGGAYLGSLVRKMKMTVIVGRSSGGMITGGSGLGAGTCASACVLVLSGGASRYFVSGSRVGVHRSHTGTRVLDPTTKLPVNAAVDHDGVREAHVAYFRQMGIDPALASRIDETPSEGIYWLSTEEMARFRLARDSAAQASQGRKKRNRS